VQGARRLKSGEKALLARNIEADGGDKAEHQSLHAAFLVLSAAVTLMVPAHLVNR
jgi:hypothetical protein